MTKGFTLLELLIVLAILGILASLIGGRLFGDDRHRHGSFTTETVPIV